MHSGHTSHVRPQLFRAVCTVGTVPMFAPSYCLLKKLREARAGTQQLNVLVYVVSDLALARQCAKTFTPL